MNLYPHFTRVILPVSHLVQQTKADCLVACTNMILGYAGKAYNYDKLANLLDTKAHGTVFSHLLRLNKLGFNFTVKEGGFDELHQLLQQNRPSIIAVRTGDLPYWRDVSEPEDVPHALVLIGLDGGIAYVNDPAFVDAPIEVPINELDLARIEQDERYAFLG